MPAFITALTLAASLAAATPPAAAPQQGARLASRASARPDQVDSTYLQAREALNRGDFRRAASLFARVAERNPDGPQAADATYWRAFALYRAGGTSDLRTARRLLDRHRERWPNATTRGEADALAVRIDGQLARGGDERSAGRVAAQADSVARRDCPRGDEEDLRVEALNALMQMDAERAMPVLKQVLARRDPCSVALRRKAMFILSQQRSPEVAAIMLNSVRTDPDAEVREQGVFWLGQVRSEQALAALDSIARRGQDPELREKAVFALSQQRDPRAWATIRAIAEDTAQSNELREKAIFWIGQNNSAENAQYLKQLFARTRSDELRDKIMFSLSQMRGQGNDEWLLSIASDRQYSTEVRKQAVFSAGQNRAPAAAMVALYDKLDDREVREQLIWVMSERRDPLTTDKVIAIAKGDKDIELRRKAIFWLGQSRDPRVQQLLLDIINQE